MTVMNAFTGAIISGTDSAGNVYVGGQIVNRPVVPHVPPSIPAVKCPTLRVKLADGRIVLVNASDYNPDIHQLWSEAGPSPTASAVIHTLVR
jgi:hypothetical protein